VRSVHFEFNCVCFRMFVFIAVRTLSDIARYIMYRNICSKSNYTEIGIGYTYGDQCMYAVCKAVQLKSKLHHVVTCSAAARPSRSLCYRPTVFFRHFRLTTLSFRKGKMLASFQKYFIFILLFQNYASLKLHNFKFVSCCKR